ncbi:MAG: glycosyltransferase [Deltaproteobacteria bacterium]|jgi:spore maturation protein CgeB|nr:glycosyltransferase [Deltaproteobacteria bacterium]
MNQLSNESPTLIKNLRYLAKANEPLAEYLGTYPSLEGLELTLAKDGSPVLVVDGLSQDSRVAPQDAANKLLTQALKSNPERKDFWLYGLGSPITLTRAAKLLGALTVYEPDPRLILANLCLIDLTENPATQKLKFLGPFDKADGRILPHKVHLITHQPSKRRDLAAWTGLVGWLDREKLPNLRLLITPPYFGGSEPMAGFVHRAAQSLGLNSRLHRWSEKLSLEAQALRADPNKNPSDLMAASAKELTAAALDYQPSLIFNLAQAPLDAKGLDLIRSQVKGALLAFWFVEDYFRFKYVNEVAPAYDLFFHIQGDLLAQPLRRWGLNNAHYLPAAADDQTFYPQNIHPNPYARARGADDQALLSQDTPFKVTLAAHGAGYPNRRAILSDLAQNFWPKTALPDSEFKIFGSGYENCPLALKGHLFEGGRRLSTLECALAYAQGQINLNIHSGDGAVFDQKSAFVNPRTFELALSASLQIVDNRPLLNDLFGPGELEIVDDPRQIPSAITKHLANPELGLEMGQRARANVQNRHLYSHRVQRIIDLLTL